jgi:hypothetical protein
VLSNTPYVWDNSISEALNVARMAQPAGPGVGMKDFDDGKKAVTGKITGGERLFDAGLGLIAMGGFGVLSMESLNDGVNRQLDWKPTVVTLIPKSDESGKLHLIYHPIAKLTYQSMQIHRTTRYS